MSTALCLARICSSSSSSSSSWWRRVLADILHASCWGAAAGAWEREPGMGISDPVPEYCDYYPSWPELVRQPRRLKQWSDAGGSAGEHWPAHYCDQRIPATLNTMQGDQTFKCNIKHWMENGKFNVSTGQRRKVIVLSFLFACASQKVNGKQYPTPCPNWQIFCI